jgi:L-arabinonolactonase
VFAVIDASGEPDGAIVDADGHVWSAQWGAARIVRHAPSGEVDRILPVPTPQPTCAAFAGAGLDTLFITSAKTGLDDDTLRALPGAGGVFTTAVTGVHGLVEARVAGA